MKKMNIGCASGAERLPMEIRKKIVSDLSSADLCNIIEVGREITEESHAMKVRSFITDTHLENVVEKKRTFCSIS